MRFTPSRHFPGGLGSHGEAEVAEAAGAVLNAFPEVQHLPGALEAELHALDEHWTSHGVNMGRGAVS